MQGKIDPVARATDRKSRMLFRLSKNRNEMTIFNQGWSGSCISVAAERHIAIVQTMTTDTCMFIV